MVVKLLFPSARCEYVLTNNVSDVYSQSVHIKLFAMVTVNITDLRQNLPAYLEKACKGQRIRVTRRGKVIAELSPPSAASDDASAARALLKGSVLRYESPLEPAVDPGEWNVNR